LVLIGSSQWKQFYGYGIGFIESFIKVIILKKGRRMFLNYFLKYNYDQNYRINGGIGSGKTTIANHFNLEGFRLYSR
jgi:ABC-type molybdenum transport system ATPase subunit/photorepair protein PhrA